MDAELQQFISLIEPAAAEWERVCQKKLTVGGKAEPVLAQLAARLAAARRTVKIGRLKKAIVLFAADHAVDGGVNESKGKQSKSEALEVAGGRGPINKVAHRVGAGVLLLDMGLQQDIPESQGVQNLKVMHGSHYAANGPAMSEDEMLDALFSGIQIGQNLADEGYTAVGIGNIGERALLTAFIITAAFYGTQMGQLKGSLKERNQMKMLSALLRTRQLDSKEPLDLLQKAGAPDIAAMTGFILSSAQRHVPVVFDNAVTGAAVLLACALQPAVKGYVFSSAAYNEPVHLMQMKYLNMKPHLAGVGGPDQGMGSVLGLSLLDAAADLLAEAR